MKLHFCLLLLIAYYMLVGCSSNEKLEDEKGKEADDTHISIKSFFGVCNENHPNVGDKFTIIIVPDNTGNIGNITAAYILFDAELKAKNETDDYNAFYFVDKYNFGETNHMLIQHPIIANISKNAPKINCNGSNKTLDSTDNFTNSFDDEKQLKYPNTFDFLFVIEYTPIAEVEFRQDFINMLHHAINSIKTIQNYRNRIGLVATKLEENIAEDIVNSIEKFLHLVKIDLQNELNLTGTSEQKLNNNLKAIEIVENLLEKNDTDKKIIITHYSKANLSSLPKFEILRREKRNSDQCNERVNEDIKIGAAAGAVTGVVATGIQIAAAVGQGASLGTVLFPGGGTLFGAVIGGLTAAFVSTAAAGALGGAIAGGAEALVSKDCR